ncbi:MAG: sensor histidine kinase, partial [Cyclobacteriaceae bacterium]
MRQEADELKLRYFTDISHELRTPLTLISVPVEAILENKRLEKKDEERLIIANNNIIKLHNLIDELIDYRKISQGKMKVNEEPVEIIGYLKSVYSAFLNISKAKNLDYGFNSNRDKGYCLFDTAILDKIMFNLISNAIKYTPDYGQVKLQVDIINETGFKINITNTGQGIPTKYQNMIFERFFQLPGGQSKESGSGIGLSIVKDYVDLLGGNITVESEPDVLTTFKLFLPYKKIKEGYIKGKTFSKHTEVECVQKQQHETLKTFELPEIPHI